MEVRRRFYASEWGSSSVTLSPEAGSESKPAHLGINQITLRTAASTPDTDFYEASGSGCGRFEVIVRKIS